MNNDENDYLKVKLHKEATIAKEKEAYFKEVTNTLDTDERLLDYFKDFDEQSVKEFKEYYAHRKVHWRFAEYNLTEFKARLDERFHKYCVDGLINIQLKKLFNTMASWMSEEVVFDGIEICWDWRQWLTKPLSCPFLPPIEKHEVQCYIDFLNEVGYDFSVADNYINLSPEDFFETDEEKGADRWIGDDAEYTYGSWFKYYDKCYDTEYFKLKPGTRVKKENVYELCAYKAAGMLKPIDPNFVQAPYLSIYEEKENFIRLFEDSDFKHLYRANAAQKEQYSFAEEIDMDLIYLSKAAETVPIESNDDWRKGVKIACEKYHRETAMLLMWDVYEEYLIFKPISGGFKEWEGEDTSQAHREQVANRILTGRRLMGEPENFNF